MNMNTELHSEQYSTAYFQQNKVFVLEWHFEAN